MSTAIEPAPAVPRVAPRAQSSSRLAHGAFWIMARRVTVVAAGVDIAFLALFLMLDSPVLAWLNLASVAMYVGAYGLLKRRINRLALLLIWAEVLGHAAIGSILVGWDSGFHYYLLMFIPAIVVSGRARSSVLLVLLLLSFYLGLHAASRMVGVLTPLSATGLLVVHSFNVAIVFAMAAYTARFYYGTVRRAERKLIELTTQDPLTGLSNRRNLLAVAETAMAHARRTKEPIALILADIDHFKQINDQHGHAVGDQALEHCGGLLSRLCRTLDVVARWGGEEFLLLLPTTGVDAATGLAERIRETVATTGVDHAGLRIGFTLSLGVTVLRAGESLSAAIARADQALYQSKANGRDRVTVVD
ncbi:GGDEF domain-containing protein [Rhodoferax sp.]|uniref:GGDEF domain-containing protein n=1 Tax=Rhodoferax sp. TaxID=50421 RepID=UPI00274DDF2B|nr:GGDEF domain-containing protein [Rhodoferax sp.]